MCGLLTALVVVLAGAACYYELAEPSEANRVAWNGAAAAHGGGAAAEAAGAPAGSGFVSRLARRLLEAPPDGGGRGRIRPVVVNGCGAPLREVRLSFVTPTGSVRRVRVASVAPGNKRRASARAAWPSQGVVTGRVEAGGTFEVGFEIGADGVLSWPLDANAPGPVTPEVNVAGAACTPGAVLKAGPTLDSLPAAAAKRAAAIAAASGAAPPASVTYAIATGDSSNSSSPANVSSSSLVSGGAPGSIPAAGGAPATAPARAAAAASGGDGMVSAAAAPAGTLALPDSAVTDFNEPVKIYILQNDIIPGPEDTPLLLFSSGGGKTTVELASPNDSGGATDNAAEGDAGENWDWTYNSDAFKFGSYITYTPPRSFLGGRIVFNYTLGSSVTNVTVFVKPPDGAILQASPDTYRFAPDADGFYSDLEVKINDSGPSGVVPDDGGDVPEPNDYLTIINFSNATKGIVELDDDGLSLSYTVTDPNFVCGTDKFYYSVTDPLWPQNRPATTWVTVTILEDPPDFESVDPEEPPLYPYAADDSFEDVPRDQVFIMAGLTNNDQVCGSTIGYAGSLDPIAGRVNRNGRSVVWYPPKGGVPKDVEYIEFEYMLRLEFIQEGNRFVADSNKGLVTIYFPTDGGEDPPPTDAAARKKKLKGIRAVGRPVDPPKKPKRVPPAKTHNKLKPKKVHVPKRVKPKARGAAPAPPPAPEPAAPAP